MSILLAVLFCGWFCLAYENYKTEQAWQRLPKWEPDDDDEPWEWMPEPGPYGVRELIADKYRRHLAERGWRPILIALRP